MLPRGLFTKRERLTLTKLGWAIFVGALAFLFGFVLLAIHPFLAVTAPVRGEILVVEGWISDKGLSVAIDEFKSHPYRWFVSTGIAVSRGYDLSDSKTYAELGAARARKLGLPDELVAVVPAGFVERDRTYESALALREWLRESYPDVKSLDLVTQSCHARRSWLLFQAALGDEYTVGIISANDSLYDEDAWWTSSEGVRNVIGETVGYIYAKFFFYPFR